MESPSSPLWLCTDFFLLEHCRDGEERTIADFGLPIGPYDMRHYPTLASLTGWNHVNGYVCGSSNASVQVQGLGVLVDRLCSNRSETDSTPDSGRPVAMPALYQSLCKGP